MKVKVSSDLEFRNEFKLFLVPTSEFPNYFFLIVLTLKCFYINPMNFKLNIIPLSLQYKQTTDSLLYYLSISIIIGKNMTAKELDITQVKDRLAPYNHLTEDTAPNAVELSVEVNPLGNISVRPTNLSIIVSSSKSYEIENIILLNIPILISSKKIF